MPLPIVLRMPALDIQSVDCIQPILLVVCLKKKILGEAYFFFYPKQFFKVEHFV